MPIKSVILLLPLLLLTHSTVMAKGLEDWTDAISLSSGKDNDSNDINVYRVGFHKNWNSSWFKGGAWFLSGYWDTELGYLETDIGTDNELVDISITPVFRFQRDADLSSGISPFAEAGIGPHLVSETRLGKHSLSTALQFGSIIGVGVGFGERGQYELSYRFQHISNAYIKEPNDDLELHLLRLGYNFY